VSRVGLIVNPAAGRDIRRLTGGASVVDNHAKRRVAECVLSGLTAVGEPPAVEVMPDRTGIAAHVVEEAPDGMSIERMEMAVEETLDPGVGPRERRPIGRLDLLVFLGGDRPGTEEGRATGGLGLAVDIGYEIVAPLGIHGQILNPVHVT
jgi:predicted polyphosphate/ATP-dependent NAD kinase